MIAAPDDLVPAHAQHFAKVLGRRDRRIPVLGCEVAPADVPLFAMPIPYGGSVQRRSTLLSGRVLRIDRQSAWMRLFIVPSSV